MARAFASTLIADLLRLMTPEEINNLTTKYSGDRRVSLTSLANNEFFGITLEEEEGQSEEKQQNFKEDREGRAKILPFSNANEGEDKKEQREQATPLAIRAGKEAAAMLAKRNPNDSTSITNVAGIAPALDEEVEVVTEKKGASLFLIEEKARLDDSKQKLREKQVMETYQKVSSYQVDVRQARQKQAQRAYKKISNMGVLVNKKHD